ncbi:MAG: hypothetical protein FMNOHCHN_01701 [Ignavibacteriaceae bacterium]|nr:hypothetical protein [Ignavibacteriaceae bacterium]
MTHPQTPSLSVISGSCVIFCFVSYDVCAKVIICSEKEGAEEYGLFYVKYFSALICEICGKFFARGVDFRTHPQTPSLSVISGSCVITCFVSYDVSAKVIISSEKEGA